MKIYELVYHEDTAIRCEITETKLLTDYSEVQKLLNEFKNDNSKNELLDDCEDYISYEINQDGDTFCLEVFVHDLKLK